MTGIRWLLASLLALLSLTAHSIDWPQEITVTEGTITVYQPQPESFEGNRLGGRAAMSLQPAGSDEQIFGTFWFDATVDTDRASDIALVRDIKVREVRWPESKDAAEQRFTAIVEAAIPASGFEISLERLAASLATSELELKSLENLNNDPPAILFREQLAVLLSYDGEPRFSDIENSSYQRAINTPVVVLREGSGKRYYLTDGTLWYEAGDPLGPWRQRNEPVAEIAAMLPAPDEDTPRWDRPPEIVVATEPTELIVTDGAPEWKPLAGGEVLYVTNTESPWLRELATGNMYLLLSGRWYRSKATDGPWTFVPADELPPAFADIPPASDIGGLRTSVAGTPEAEEAMLDAQIPQTAAIKRDTTLSVSYEGKPQFEAIPGTKVAYAVNTATQVLRVDGRYYAVDNGVWFEADSATGPWQVADEVPESEIAQIPPSSPVYNTTYVNIYDSTPDVVYVGYRPGYMWSFPYYGVPVYGSGWYYRPWPGPWYYPRPPTWGFNVGYNPWTGWNFGVSWSNGFFSFGMSFGGGYHHHHHGGWYGGGYRGPTFINTGDINIGNTINVGNRVDIDKRLRNGDVKLNRDGLRRDNLYARPENRARNANPALAQGKLNKAVSKRDLGNNIYADRDGRVARHVDNQWQTRDKGGWKPDAELNRPTSRDNQKPAARPATPAIEKPAIQKPATRPATPSLPQPATRDIQRPSTRPAAAPDRRGDLERARAARAQAGQRERSRPRPQRARR